MRGRWWSGPICIVLAGLGLALLLLLLPLSTDGSYTCDRSSALTDFIKPEPEAPASFRANFFDSGYACNQDAEHRGALTAVAFAPFIIAATTWAVVFRRRRGAQVVGGAIE
jgi:hypothetical protein